MLFPEAVLHTQRGENAAKVECEIRTWLRNCIKVNDRHLSRVGQPAEEVEENSEHEEDGQFF